MHPSEEDSKLNLVPAETSEELAHRFQRERRAVSLQREDRLGASLAPFRVGSVPYLNAVPLTRGLESQVVFHPPSELARQLRNNELDAALVSVTEALFNDCYDVLDGIAIAALGEVKSVFLAHRRPLAEIEEVFCDTSSLASVNLLRVLLGEHGWRPRFKPLPSHADAAQADYVLLIGNPALDFALSEHTHEIWDLGSAWLDLTNLPFVYAVWTLRRGVENASLRRQLREAKDFGVDTLDHIIATRTEYSYDFRKDYLTWHIHFHLGSDEKRGMAKFIELLRKHTSQTVYEPRFVA
ncbi:MAG: menaquinone biosynthesis protein [Candidatus Omnitrophica bacterium]|nr:menaquinone biosynthesis protein [Candidatus Omnitrophota bacterium]